MDKKRRARQVRAAATVVFLASVICVIGGVSVQDCAAETGQQISAMREAAGYLASLAGMLMGYACCRVIIEMDRIVGNHDLF